MAKLKSVSVSFSLPYIGGIQGTWEPDESQRNAAWEMYVELVTRISVAEIGLDEGLMREGLSSLYSLFGTTREILRKYGPSIAQPKGEDNLSLGYLAVAVLNTALRPVLAKWHPLLLDYENMRDTSLSSLEHEKRWERAEELRQALNETRTVLVEYAGLLAQAAGVPSLIVKRS